MDLGFAVQNLDEWGDESPSKRDSQSSQHQNQNHGGGNTNSMGGGSSNMGAAAPGMGNNNLGGQSGGPGGAPGSIGGGVGVMGGGPGGASSHQSHDGAHNMGAPASIPQQVSSLGGKRPPESQMRKIRKDRNEATRYFVIKCNNHRNLVMSIQNNVWATQKHNEEKLNEALRVAPYVVLLFSVNMSGNFQGYARMLGRVGESKKPDPFNGFGELFDVKWLKLHDLDFQEIPDVVNPWNENKQVKISRDGQELPHHVGRTICAHIDVGVYKADPANFAPDDEQPSPIPPDAPLVGSAIPDRFSRKGGGKYGGGGGGKYGGGYGGKSGGSSKKGGAWRPQNTGPYGGGKGGSRSWQPAPAQQAAPPKTSSEPDFVNMSYSEYQSWYAAQQG